MVNYWQIVINIVQTLTLVAITWTAHETFLLRRVSQAQLKMQMRPLLSFLPKNPAYVVKNVSKNPALNIFCFSKRKDIYYITSNNSHVIAILPPDNDTGDNYQINGFNSEKIISKKELIKQFPWVYPLLGKLEEENELTRLIICYEDVFKNKLFTFNNSSGGSYDSSCETGYISDII